ncbi:polyketide synthase dehydratase domain-containing protein, partial [Streptomyces sp. NPDC000618]|uniref:polyketide synthase dehydratase domain-containing protein n=1 Tax=Streptomyces sp. NPDC000618 TaxID=3154265 RepID=UPI0033211030
EFAQRGRKTKRLTVSHAFHSARMEPMLDEFRAVLEGVTFGRPELTIVSDLTGRPAGAEELGSPDYWVRQVREAVRFADGVQYLRSAGTKTFLELGPDGPLSALVHETGTPVPDATVSDTTVSEAITSDVAAAPVLRAGRGESEALLSALALGHARGCPTDWSALPLPTARPDLDLPTYAFQRRHYWLDGTAGASADAAGLGLVAAGHPLLGATVRLAGTGGGVMLTGRISLQAQPWLRDHAVVGRVLLPGAAFADLAVRAGDRVGCRRVDELTLQTPLVIPGQGALALQVHVEPQGADGRRPVGVYSRDDAAGEDGEWTCHAVGFLAESADDDVEDAVETAESAVELAVWPPVGSRPVDIDGFYVRAAAAGYGYGPAFQGLRALYRGVDGELFAEVGLPAELTADAGRFGVHPALLDAALHALVAAGFDAAPRGEEPALRLPFAWHGVTLHAAGPTVLRVRLAPVDGNVDTIGIQAVDVTGQAVLTAEALELRTADPAQLQVSASSAADSLYPVVWTPVARPTSDSAPVEFTGTDADADTDLTFHYCTSPLVDDENLARAAEEAAVRLLAALQGWLAEATTGENTAARLVVVTRGAIATALGDPVSDLVHAPVWGLVRSAQSEHPDRFLLIDADPDDDADAADPVEAARVALTAGETQVAVRAGAVLAPRLTRAGRSGTLVPSSDVWRLESAGSGTLEGLVLGAAPEAAEPLGVGQVRVAVRVAGLNFRDVLIALGVYPGAASMGGEGAGVVCEVGSGVTGFAVGDQVFGMFASFGPLAVADARTVAPIPDGWSWERAASVPVVFLTAYYGLVELGTLRAGESVLIHA